jgi:hypothetical protein
MLCWVLKLYWLVFSFHEDTVQHVISGSRSKWCEGWSHLKKLFVPHLGNTIRNKLEDI